MRPVALPSPAHQTLPSDELARAVVAAVCPVRLRDGAEARGAERTTEEYVGGVARRQQPHGGRVRPAKSRGYTLRASRRRPTCACTGVR